MLKNEYSDGMFARLPINLRVYYGSMLSDIILSKCQMMLYSDKRDVRWNDKDTEEVIDSVSEYMERSWHQELDREAVKKDILKYVETDK